MQNAGGDKEAAHEYMGKASAAAPDDPHYAYYCIRYYEDTDPALWRTKVYELVKRFPDDERGAQALFQVATHASNAGMKIEALEQLRTLYDPHKFEWANRGMNVLYDTYMEAGQTAEAKGLAVAMGTGEGWDLRQSLARWPGTGECIDEGQKYAEALKKLATLKAPRNSGLAKFSIRVESNCDA